MSEPLQPTLHKPVPMKTRVKIPSYFHADKEKERFGFVAGVASCHVIFTYIVLLDEPLETPYGEVNAVVVNGPELEAEDGSNWKLEE